MTDSRLSRVGKQLPVTQAGGDVAARLSRIGEQLLLTQAGGDISARVSRVGFQIMIRTGREGWDLVERNPIGP